MKRVVIVLSAVLLLLSSCNTRREVTQVWDYIRERPDSALAVLDAMDASRFHGRTRAEYCLLKAMALDKNYVNVSSDSLALPAVEFFRRYGPREKEMMSVYYLAVSRFYAGNYSEAMLLLEQTTEMAEQLVDHFYAGLGHIMKSRAFLRTYCISEAVKSAELGVAAFEAIPDAFQVQRAKLQLADTYHSSKEFEKALRIYQELIDSCQQDPVTMRWALMHGAYSMFLAHPEQADSSMSYYERALEEYGARMSPLQAAHYADVACAAGNTALAHQIVEQLKETGSRPEQVTYLEYKLHTKENKPWDALASVEQFHEQLDSIMYSSLEQSLIQTQRNYQEEQKHAAKQSLFLTRLIGTICLLCLFVMLLAVVLHYARKQRMVVQERDQLISSVGETARLLQEREQKNSDLEQNLQALQKRYISSYKKQFSKLSSLVASYYATSGKKEGRDIVYGQVMEIAATIGTDQASMAALEREVNAALDNAMRWYREEFPGRPSAHYSMVCLFMAGFNFSIMELLTGIPKNTLYSKKSRLLEEIREGSAEHRDLFLLAIK